MNSTSHSHHQVAFFPNLSKRSTGLPNPRATIHTTLGFIACLKGHRGKFKPCHSVGEHRLEFQMTVATGVATSFAWLQIGSVAWFSYHLLYSKILTKSIDNRSNYPKRDYVSVCQRSKYHDINYYIYMSNYNNH